MPQSLVKMAVHVVFGTKQRKNLTPQNRLEDLWAYLGGIARNQKIRLLIAGGMRDHLQMLVEIPATRNLSRRRKNLQIKFFALDARKQS